MGMVRGWRSPMKDSGPTEVSMIYRLFASNNLHHPCHRRTLVHVTHNRVDRDKSITCDGRWWLMKINCSQKGWAPKSENLTIENLNLTLPEMCKWTRPFCGDRSPEVTQKPFLGPGSLSLQCRHWENSKVLAGCSFCELVSQCPQSSFLGFSGGCRGGSAAVCDPSPPRPFARC